MKRTSLAAVVIALFVGLGAALPAAADFDRLTSQIERIGNIDRQFIPFFGLGRLLVRAFKPEGVRDVKLAVFEDHTSGRDIDLDRLVGDNFEEGWSQIIRATSRDGEEVFVYAQEEGRFVRVIVVAREDGEIVVVETSLNPDTFAEHLMDGSLGDHRGR